MADAGSAIATVQNSRKWPRISAAAVARHAAMSPRYIQPMYGVSWNFEPASSRWMRATPARPTAAAERVTISAATRPRGGWVVFMPRVLAPAVHGPAALGQRFGQGRRG